MKIQNYFIVLGIMYSSLVCPSDFSWEFVRSPIVTHYQPLFEKFGQQICAVCAGRQITDQDASSVCFAKNKESYLDAFYAEFQAHESDDTNRLFIHVTFLDEVIGFMSCQIVSERQVVIQQLVIDPEKYDDALVKDFLFAILQLMPKVKEISIVCPAFDLDFLELFKNFGFAYKNQAKDNGLFAHLALKVHPKCAMCEVLYGADFWENEDPNAWEQDPDKDDLPVGFYNVDESRDDVSPLPEDDDGKSSY